MEVSRTEAQTLSTNDYILFNDDIVIPPSKCMYYNKTTGLTTLTGKCKDGNCYAVFKVTFSTNLAADAPGNATIAIAIDGVAVEKSEMSVVSAAADDAFTVARTMFVKVPRYTSATVGVKSTTAADVTVLDSILIIERVA